MFGKGSKNRFDVVHKEKIGVLSGCKVLVDKETGVQYLFSWYGEGAGITPLLDKEGKPIIRAINE
ncbi:DUF6440 family protein [Rossellomorea sp. NS-SX7]|uniref:DUF6440 family protein n=1 Tax=Rossellomorea sp. NS-SX7 TaxID=3463856 RepID=UPI004058DC93